ncbi:MAG TPA: serine/threonine-protein kinase [Polyangiaceae bacterium]
MSQAVRRESADERGRGTYQILFQLGRGGMGTVYLARALGAGGFERLVVIKRLNAHLLDQDDAVRRFMDEARIAARVHHANVIGTQQVGSDDDGPFLVLDYVEGGSLGDLLDRSVDRGELIPPPIVLRIALDALAGLYAVHTAQDAAGRALDILHRDVSLQNVLVGRDGVARIADFGIAKSALGSVTTDKSYVVGKLLYMPREYLCRETPAPTLDVYALGITLWLALSGHELWPDVSEAQLITHIVEDTVPRLSTVMRIPPQIEELVATAVHPDPARRFASARVMADEIERLSRQTGWVASHAEVAQFLEQLLGAELRERRGKLARYLEIGDSPAARSALPSYSGDGRASAHSVVDHDAPEGDPGHASASVRAQPRAPHGPKLLVLPAPDEVARSQFADASSVLVPRADEDRQAGAAPPAAEIAARAGANTSRDRRSLRLGAGTFLVLILVASYFVLSRGGAPAATANLSASAPAARAALRTWSSLAEPISEQEPLAPQPSVETRATVAKPAQRAATAARPRVEPELDRNRAPRSQVKTPRQSAEPKSGIRKNPYR